MALRVWALAAAALLAGTDGTREARERMVTGLQAYPEPYRVSDQRVLDALRRVPRERFVPRAQAPRAYADTPLPIGEGQTISAPGIVAAMTQALSPSPSDLVLEVGTGSGYQAAVLSLLVRHVYSVEIVEVLGRRAAARLDSLGYKNVSVRVGDGYRGWPEAAPFDAVIVTCAPEDVPRPLVEQLKEGGRLVIPVGPDGGTQWLWVYRKTDRGLVRQALMPVRFVPMTGEAQH
ncbi:protein-L-isoaspartate(D-aspartate) O-methyltransferase [bacterium]|nr:MAG: protein-L-isoaspartate(D-aspartate) O-methyltransferase [bacterium]